MLRSVLRGWGVEQPQLGWLLAMMILVASVRFVSLEGGVAAPAQTRATYTDPFAYCAAVGTIDAPDDRYTGPRVPESVALGLQQDLGLPAEKPLPVFLRGTFWRCMEGKVYACNVGANIPCQEKADTSRTPSQAMIEYCRKEGTRDAIPAYVTGRATVYAWGCRDGKPYIVRQVSVPDPRGFIQQFWHPIEPPAVVPEPTR